MVEKGTGNGKIGKYLMSDILDCAGNNGYRYLDKFQRLNEKGRSFNWCAALFSFTWFAYRRMWKAAGILFGVNLVLYTTDAFIRLSSPYLFASGLSYEVLSLVIALLMMIACGFLGDWLYIGRLKTIMDHHGCGEGDTVRDEAWEASLKKAGGTSVMGVVLSLAAGFVIQLILTFSIRLFV